MADETERRSDVPENVGNQEMGSGWLREAINALRSRQARIDAATRSKQTGGNPPQEQR